MRCNDIYILINLSELVLDEKFHRKQMVFDNIFKIYYATTTHA